MIIETTNYTVMCCSKRKKQSKMEIGKENTRGKSKAGKVRNMWHMSKNEIIIFFGCNLKDFGCAVM